MPSGLVHEDDAVERLVRTGAHRLFERLGYNGTVSRAFKKYLLAR